MATASSHCSVPKSFSSGDAPGLVAAIRVVQHGEWMEGRGEGGEATNPPRRWSSGSMAWSEWGRKNNLRLSQEVPHWDPHADGVHGARQIPDSSTTQSGEALSVFSHDLKKQLEQAMPEIDSKVRDQLLLHQIVASLPIPVSKRYSQLMQTLGDAGMF